ncbi:MAG: carboxylating nicotinate-nucleotide diphosphorylase [Nitrospirae bacterium]|nr:carboxylating nicotinate-nucleotide diphosphorylase [Nitrospirota bacterium]
MEIPHSVKELIRIALEEDIGSGDITTSLLIPEKHESNALITAKGDFILSGIPFVKEVFALLDQEIKFSVITNDGSKVTKGTKLAELQGKTHSILSGERVSLNILQRLSGIATLTNMFAERIKGLNTTIVDTRKTTPGLRFMEKYAVRCGGGSNHRFGLFDGILIKDNHIEAVGGIRDALRITKEGHPLTKIEIEVKNLTELKEAIEGGAEIIMLDNMSIEDMNEAVQIVRKTKKGIILEASGNVSLDNVRQIAETGVDWISIGALTHSAPAADISMKIVR